MKKILTFLITLTSFVALAQCPAHSPVVFTTTDGGGPGCDVNTWKHEQGISTTNSGTCLVLAGTTCDLSWYTTKYSLDCAFCANFTFTLSTATSDGIAFNIADVTPRGTAFPCSTPIGCAEGGNLGYNGLTSTGTGGGGALTVEFDVFNNSAAGDADPSCSGGTADHIAIVEDGNNDSFISRSCTTPLNMDDGLSHNASICWDPSINRLTVTVDGTTYITLNANIRSYFTNPTSVNFAFSSGYNGSFSGSNSVCNFTVTGTLHAKDLGFKGKVKNNKIELNWKSNNNDETKYEILRSRDGLNYETINTVYSSSNRSNYSFTDHTPLSGFNYYKISEEILSTKEVTESDPVVLKYDGNTNSIYLNKKELNFIFEEQTEYKIKIQNMLGKNVHESTLIGNSIINLSHLINGVYIVSVISNNDFYSHDKIYLAD
jgi:hypothetical protein